MDWLQLPVSVGEWTSTLDRISVEIGLTVILVLGFLKLFEIMGRFLFYLRAFLYRHLTRGRINKMSRRAKNLALKKYLSDRITDILEEGAYQGIMSDRQKDYLYRYLARRLDMYDLLPRKLPQQHPTPKDLKEAIKQRMHSVLVKAKLPDWGTTPKPVRKQQAESVPTKVVEKEEAKAKSAKVLQFLARNRAA